MKNVAECAKNLAALRQRLPEGPPAEFPDADEPAAVLVMSYLMWESSTAKALVAYQRLQERIVDLNDLRVCMPHEAADYLGDDSERGLERCQRLRATLRNVFLREHAVSLESLKGARKREVRKYIDSLEGIVPYVAARVMLLSFDTHALPVDGQLCSQLVAAGAADENAEVGEVAAFLARHIKAGQGKAAHYAFQAWIDEVGPKTRASKDSRKTKKKTTGRSSAKKTETGKRGSAAKKTADSGAT